MQLRNQEKRLTILLKTFVYFCYKYPQNLSYFTFILSFNKVHHKVRNKSDFEHPVPYPMQSNPVKQGNSAAKSLKINTSETYSLLRPLFDSYFWIMALPALMEIECLLACIRALRMNTFVQHILGNISDFLVPFVDVRMNFLQMHIAILIDDIGLLEDTVHVALELFIFVNIAVAELCNGI